MTRLVVVAKRLPRTSHRAGARWQDPPSEGGPHGTNGPFRREVPERNMTAMTRTVRLVALAAVVIVLGTGAGSAAPTRAATLPLAGIVIALDPGHNGGNASHLSIIDRLVWIGDEWKACNTVGTTTRAGYPEHRFTFAVAQRVKLRLEALGAIVRMTRTTDDGVGPCVTTRGRFGASVGAVLELSIHGDGGPTSGHGFTVMKPGYLRGYTDDIVSGSATLAGAIRAGLLSGGLPVSTYYGTNGLQTRKDLGTLNLADVPTVMVELGNMKNAGDAARMTSAAGRDHYAAALVAGIRRYLSR